MPDQPLTPENSEVFQPLPARLCRGTQWVLAGAWGYVCYTDAQRMLSEQTYGEQLSDNLLRMGLATVVAGLAISLLSYGRSLRQPADHPSNQPTETQQLPPQ